MGEYQREHLETDRRYMLRKMTDASFNRMRQLTAKQQLAEAMRLSRGPDEIPEPDADDSSWRGND